MRIRPPHNPDVLTYRDSVVYAADRIQLEQRRLSSSIDVNGTLVDTYFLTLTILRPTIDDEGRYVCARRKHVFAEYDLFIIGEYKLIDFLSRKNFLSRRKTCSIVKIFSFFFFISVTNKNSSYSIC